MSPISPALSTEAIHNDLAVATLSELGNGGPFDVVFGQCSVSLFMACPTLEQFYPQKMHIDLWLNAVVPRRSAVAMSAEWPTCMWLC